MIGWLLWLIYFTYLFGYSNARCLVADDSQWFGVNMGFSDEDRILMENLYVFKGYGAKKFIKEFLNKGNGTNSSKKLQETGTTARRNSSIESIQNIACFPVT